jgi:hypothetical protein
LMTDDLVREEGNDDSTVVPFVYFLARLKFLSGLEITTNLLFGALQFEANKLRVYLYL